MGDFVASLLQGRVALVTGGGTGIGKEIARTLGRHGATVVICGRRQEVLEAAREELTEEGIVCEVFALDIRNASAVEAMIAALLERLSRLDVVVNNAAGNFPAKIEDLSYNGFKTIVDIDLIGTYNVTRAAYTLWLKDHGGSIINITAPFAHWGVSYQAHVAAAKAGVESLTRTCAVEWASRGIRVNSVAPGAIADTEGMERTAHVFGDAGGSARRVGTRQDVANVVLFLSSDAASFISGNCIRVDGAATIDMLKLPVDV